MADSIELDDFSNRKPEHDESINHTLPTVALSDDANDGVISVWTFTTAGLLFALASALVWTPGFILLVGSTSEQVDRTVLLPTERFLARHLGFYLYAISMALALNLPSAAPVEKPGHGVSWHPLLLPLTTLSVVSAFSAYNTLDVGALSSLVAFANGIIGGFGAWTMVFAGSSYVSRKTGADKRTSRFLFGNKAAASSQKKEWKKKRES